MTNMTIIKDIPVHVGDTVCVYYKVIEHETEAGKTKKEVKDKVRERLQPYEGIVIGIKGVGENQSFMVRRLGVGDIGIERIFPVISPWIQKITVKKHGIVRRAKLYYLRKAKNQLKIKEEKVTIKTPTKTKIAHIKNIKKQLSQNKSDIKVEKQPSTS